MEFLKKYPCLVISLFVIGVFVAGCSSSRAQLNGALISASENGNIEEVRKLIADGADVHARHDYALRLAARDGHLSVVEYLVDQGSDVRVRDDQALRWAARNGHTEVVEYLRLVMEE